MEAPVNNHPFIRVQGLTLSPKLEGQSLAGQRLRMSKASNHVFRSDTSGLDAFRAWKGLLGLYSTTRVTAIPHGA